MRIRKTFTICLILALLLASFSGCKEEVEAPMPTQSLEGFTHGAEESGGGTLADANLNHLSARQAGEDSVVRIEFIGGSRMSAGTSERTVRNVPHYTVEVLPEPARLAISFETVLYWDYVRDIDIASCAFVRGSFAETSPQSSAFTLYLQLAGDAAFQVAEDSTSLEITLRPIEQPAPAETPEGGAEDGGGAIDLIDDETAGAGEAFYLTGNAFDAWCSGAISRDAALSPVLADDLTTVLLISEGFSTRSAAEALRTRILAQEANAVASDWSVVKLIAGELPPYDETMEYTAAYEQKPLRIDGVETALEPRIPDGLFLAVTPARDGYLYSKRIKRSTLGESYEYEQLYLQGADGAAKPLFAFEFQTIESAAYSPDGRKLAVLERAAESAHLYVFDLDTKELLTDLAEMGFGDTVSAYTWDSMGSRVFSIGGSGETAVHQYDFGVPAENKRHTTVDKKGVDESSLAYYDGEVYFCETSLEGGATIYRIKPEGGVRRSFAAGSAFAFSPDGSRLALSATAGDSASGGGSAFSILDLATGETTAVTADFPVHTFLWSPGGTRLFFIENRLSGASGEVSEATGGENDPYPYRLWVYDVAGGALRSVADLPLASIAASGSEDEVLLRYTDSATMGDIVRATYAIPVD